MTGDSLEEPCYIDSEAEADSGRPDAVSLSPAKIKTKRSNEMIHQPRRLFSGITGLSFLVLIIAVGSQYRAGGGEATPVAQAVPAPDEGIAARYPGDAGIAKNPAVLFSDDFESWGENGIEPPSDLAVKSWSIRYDPRQRIVTGDKEATAYLRRDYRAPWQHPGKG